jgi:hypothetical protein
VARCACVSTDEVAHGERARGERRAAAEQRAQPGEELGEGERLGEVVVGARVEPGHAVGHRVAGREHEDRRARAAGAQLAAHVEPPAPGEAHVEHDHVVVRHRRVVQPALAVGRDVDGVRVLDEPLAEQGGERRVVFDDEDAHAGVRSGR